MRYFVLIVFLMLSVLIWHPAPETNAQRPDAPQYAQRGPYVVGTREFVIDEDGERPLEATIWYPALNPDDEDEITTYRFSLLEREGRALQDAEPDAASGPYPLIVFSHGLGGMRIQSLFYTEHLASYGFVVIAVDHPGSTFLDMAVATDAESLLQSFALRPIEVLREIDFVESLAADGEIFAGIVDMEQIAITGHSFGGYTTASLGGAQLNTVSLRPICETEGAFEGEVSENQEALCSLGDLADVIAAMRGLDEVPDSLWEPTTDPRIRAIVPLAPWVSPIFDEEGFANITVPTMIMVGSTDQVTVPEPNAYQMYEHIESQTKSLVVFENADHFIFADSCVDLFIQLDIFNFCSDPVWDMDRAHDLTNHFATAFFRAILYGDDEARAALDDTPIDFTGIEYEFISAD